MKLHLKILIETQLKNSAVRLIVPAANGGFNNLELINDSVHTLESYVGLDYHGLPDSVQLCQLDGFVPGLDQRIIIKGITINDRPIDPGSFWDLLDFSVEGSDHVIANCHEICLNGTLRLSVRSNQDRLFWCPYYYSTRKDDFVFNNSLLDDYGSDIRTYRGDERTSIKKYKNSPHHDYNTDNVYDFACFGCSVTYGTGLSVKDRWSNLLSPDSLNLAVPGMGIDGIFLNLKNALEKFQFQKIIILLPIFDRRLVRLRLPGVDAFCRIPVNSTSLDWHHSQIKHWAWEMMGIQHNRSELEEWKRTYEKTCLNMVLEGDRGGYSKRVLDRMLTLLLHSGKEFYLSSWDEEVYAHLLERVDGSRILPYFRKIDTALDGLHPGPRGHREWATQIDSTVKLSLNLVKAPTP